jgi:hypothetical protein
MIVLAALPFCVAAFGLGVVVYRLARLRCRLRANLAGCAGYPVLKSSRRPAYLLTSTVVPLRLGQCRAAERSWSMQGAKS